MLPRKMKSRDMIDMEVRTVRDMENGYGIIPKGTVVQIVSLMNCFSVETLPCPHCGRSLYMCGVTRADVELPGDSEEGRPTEGGSRCYYEQFVANRTRLGGS